MRTVTGVFSLAVPANAGDRLFDACAEELAKAVRAIKADTEAKRLQDEFYAGSEAPF